MIALQFVNVGFANSKVLHNFVLTVVCTTLGNPSNGMVSLTGTSIGDTATYTCDDGYELYI